MHEQFERLSEIPIAYASDTTYCVKFDDCQETNLNLKPQPLLGEEDAINACHPNADQIGNLLRDLTL